MAKIVLLEELRSRVAASGTTVFAEFVEGGCVLLGPVDRLERRGDDAIFQMLWCAMNDAHQPGSGWSNCCVVAYNFREDSLRLIEKEPGRIFFKTQTGGATIYLDGRKVLDPSNVEGIDPRFLEHQG